MMPRGQAYLLLTTNEDAQGAYVGVGSNALRAGDSVTIRLNETTEMVISVKSGVNDAQVNECPQCGWDVQHVLDMLSETQTQRDRAEGILRKIMNEETGYVETRRGVFDVRVSNITDDETDYLKGLVVQQ